MLIRVMSKLDMVSALLVLWCFLFVGLKGVEQTVRLPVIWDSPSLLCHSNERIVYTPGLDYVLWSYLHGKYHWPSISLLQPHLWFLTSHRKYFFGQLSNWAEILCNVNNMASLNQIQNWGGVLVCSSVFPGIGIPMIRIRQWCDHQQAQCLLQSSKQPW